MIKIKIITIILGLFFTAGSVTLGLVYKRNVEERKDLNEKIEQLSKEIKEAKDVESAVTIEVLGTSEVKEDVMDKPPVYIPPIDTDPTIACSKGKCGTKSVKQSECTKAVCCEIKKDTYELSEDSQECNSLKAENARIPVTLPHNGKLYYCDKSSQNAVKQASENIKEQIEEDRKQIDKDRESCLQKCNIEPGFTQAMDSFDSKYPDLNISEEYKSDPNYYSMLRANYEKQVLASLQSKSVECKGQCNELIDRKVALKKQLVDLSKRAIAALISKKCE